MHTKKKIEYTLDYLKANIVKDGKTQIPILNLLKKRPEVLNFQKEHPNASKDDILEFIYCLVNEIEYPKRCKCGNKCYFVTVALGYSSDVCGKHGCPYSIKAKTEKYKQTCLKKFGVENISQLAETRAKVIATNIKKFGTACNLTLDSTKEKIKQTCLKKYGTTSARRSDIVKEKIEKTNLLKYGAITPAKNKAVIEKMKQTNLEKYGCVCTLHNEEIQKKARESFAIQHLEKILKRFNEAPGLPTKPLFTKADYIAQEGSRYNTMYKWKCTKCGNEFLHSYAHGRLPLCPICFPKTISSGHQELLAFIQSIHKFPDRIYTNNRTVIPPYELDIYLPDLNLAFEFNGTYWHNIYQKEKDYHLNKTKLCEEKGIKLIHIWEYDWLDYFTNVIIKNRISNLLGDFKKTIYARKCNVKEISASDANDFLDQHHLQGSINSKVNLGLYYQDELVSVMTFSDPRFNKNYQWELLRFANHSTYHIPGAASKLLKYFEKEYKHNSLISYADLSWGYSTLYSNLGFTKLNKDITPNYVYIDKVNNLRYTRYQSQKHKLKDLLGEDKFDPNKSETDNMLDNGFLKLYDCGNLVFVKEYGNAKE